MRTFYILILLLFSLSSYTQETVIENDSIFEIIINNQESKALPKDLINKIENHPKDSIFWLSLKQKEYCGDYLYLDQQIYCGSLKCYTLPLKVDESSFEVLNSTTYSRDRNHVYCYNDYICDDSETGCGACSCSLFIVKNANPKTFQLIEEPYSTDTVHIYFLGHLIDCADYSTFKIITISGDLCFSCDRNNVYFGNQIVTDADPSTFHCHEKYIYKDQFHTWEYNPANGKFQKIQTE